MKVLVELTEDQVYACINEIALDRTKDEICKAVANSPWIKDKPEPELYHYLETEIVYLPHCGKCGNLIEDKVEYRARQGYGIVEPQRCEVCGSAFTGILVNQPQVHDERSLDNLYKEYNIDMD